MIKRHIGDIVFYVLIILLWQMLFYLGCTVFHWWKVYAFPCPGGVLKSLIDMLQGGNLGLVVLNSLFRVLKGYVLAVIIGTFVGIIIVLIPSLNRRMKPVLLGFQTLPSICWTPFAIICFGLTERNITFVVVTGSVFGFAIAFENAVRNVDILLIKAAKTMGASHTALILRVILPAAVPELIAALKHTWSFAWRALMTGEMISSCLGLGYVLAMGRDMADINRVAAVMVLIIVVGILVENFIFQKIEIRVLMARGIKMARAKI